MKRPLKPAPAAEADDVDVFEARMTQRRFLHKVLLAAALANGAGGAASYALLHKPKPPIIEEQLHLAGVMVAPRLPPPDIHDGSYVHLAEPDKKVDDKDVERPRATKRTGRRR